MMRKSSIPFVSLVSSDSLNELQDFINGEIDGRLSADGSLKIVSIQLSAFVAANDSNWYIAIILFEPKKGLL